MTVSSTSNLAQFNGNDATVLFPFTFKVFAEADLDVIQTSALDVDTTLTLTTDYSVSLNADQNNDPGGDVTLVVAPATGETLSILRVVDATQETDITNGGGFYPEVIENALDRLTMLAQQNAEEISRSVKVGVASSATPDELVASISASESAAAASAAAAGVSEVAAAASELAAAASAVDAADALAAIPVDALVPADIGATIQAYDADTAKLDVDQTWTGAQRGTLTTDNDGSFDQNVTNNFACTPTGAAALTFTNHTAGQTGLILFVNGSNYAITAAATTYIAAADLTKLSATGTYLIAYLDNGTNAYCTVTAALTSAGA